MFTQAAYNLANLGFYPSDDATLECVKSSLTPVGEGDKALIFDPCCGEGDALETLATYLENTQTCGIEIDKERADKARQKIDNVVQADIQDCYFGQGANLLFLNPPYGASLDREETKRLEEVFTRKAINSLVFNGIMVLVVPGYIVNQTFARYLCQRFDNLVGGLSPETRFKQVVIMGRKIKTTEAENIGKRSSALIKTLGNPWITPQKPYVIPTTRKPFAIKKVSIDKDNLQLVISKSKTLWDDMKILLGANSDSIPKPLMPLTDWHTGLALSSGCISGVVKNDSHCWLVKGSTYKTKVESIETEYVDDVLVTKTTLLDKFVPIIKAIDINVNSDSFSHVLEIK